MTEKEKIIKEVLWLGVELFHDDYDGAELSIKEIKRYIKNGGEKE